MNLLQLLTIITLIIQITNGEIFPFHGLNLTELSQTQNFTSYSDLIFNYDTSEKFFHADANSWFGYSISGFFREGKSYCIVGTPKYYDEDHGETTGRIYRLELDYQYPGCSIMTIPNNDEDRRQHGGTPFPAKSMFIGGSLSAYANQNNEVQLACDPRFLYMPNHSNESSKFNQVIGTGHCVVYTGMSLKYLSIDSCSSHEEGSCLSGFSSSIRAGDKRGEIFLALGLPGSYLTEGNVYFAHFDNKKLVSSSRLKSSPRDFKHVGYNLGYDVKVAQLNRLPSTLESSELGYDTDAISGLVLNKNSKFHIITSATSWTPNDYRGIVMIIDQAMDLGGIQYLKDQWGHIGSYFGYSLEILDLDGNGIADIVVSSPYFSEKRDESRPDSSLKPDIGRVYIFYGNNQTNPSSFSYDTERPVVLEGLKMKWGRFGHSMANLGDVDGDGTEDLAISCPFCRKTAQSKNVGAVFIYFGRQNTRINDSPMQIIFSDNIPSKNPMYTCEIGFDEPDRSRFFKSFGWSLSSGIDIDTNQAPDLIVGDYDTGQIVSLKSRSFLWFDEPKWIMNRTQFIQYATGNDSYCNDKKCRYKVELSIAVRGRKTFIQQNRVHLLVTVDLDTMMDENKRIGDSSEINPLGGPSVIQRKVLLESLSLETNRITIMDLMFEPKLRETRKNKWMPIIMNATIEPFFDEINMRWSLHPYLGQRTFTSEKLHFTNTECGDDQVCNCDLMITLIGSKETDNIIYYKERITQRNVTFGLANNGENAYNAQLRVMIPKQFSYTPPNDLNCLVENDNDQEATHFHLKCSIGDPLRNTGVHYRPFTFNLNTATAFSLLKNSNSEPSSSSSKKNLTKDLKKADIRMYPEELKVIAQLSSGNPDKDIGNNRIELSYKLRLFAKVHLSSSSQESATMDRRNFSRLISFQQKIEPNHIGPQVKHTYLLTNDGPSPIENLQVNLSIPIMTRDRENLLYILDRIRYQDMNEGPPLTVDTFPSVISTDSKFNGSCYIPEEFVNPLKLQAVDKINTEQLQKNRRTIRSVSHVQGGDLFGSRDYLEDEVDDRRRFERDSQKLESFLGLSSILPNGRIKQQEIIRCGLDFADLGKPICAKVICQINKLNSRDTVRINFRAWLWSETLFRHKISDIGVVTEATCQLPERAFKIDVHGSREVVTLAISQSFVFEGIKSLITNDIPIWPIVLGILVGAVLLTLIIIAMWKCGFFKRRRWYDHSEMHNGSSVLDSSKMAHL